MTLWDDNAPEPEVPPLFKETDGLRFFYGREGYVLRAGAYHDGKGALVIYTDRGECEGKLTVNLEVWGKDALAPYEFFVKIDLESQFMSIATHLLTMGVFTTPGRLVPAGHVTEYAHVWRFAQCNQDPVTVVVNGKERKIEHSPTEYRIRCKACREHFDALYEDRRIAIQADEAIGRIKNMKEKL